MTGAKICASVGIYLSVTSSLAPALVKLVLRAQLVTISVLMALMV